MKTRLTAYRYIFILLAIMIIFQVPALGELNPDASGDYLYEETAGGIIITGYTGEDTALVLPSVLDGKAVIAVRSLGIQSGVERITIPDDVHVIGNPFSGCYTLTGFDVSPSHPELCAVDGILFSKDMTQLIRYPSERENEVYVISGGVRTICNSAFSDCPFLKEIQIPDTVESIGSGAFCLCTGLKELHIPSGVKIVGKMAFGNTGLQSMDLSTCAITEIPDRLFYGCYALEEVKLSPAVTSIGSEAFAFTNLKSFTLPSGIKHIGINPFRDCQFLHGFQVDSNIQEFAYDAPYLIDLTESRLIACITTVDASLTLPEVMEIGDYCLAANHSLVHLIIPPSVVRIGNGAFTECLSLEDVLIQECTNLHIAKLAFSDCSSLTHVTVLADISILEEDIFSRDDSLQEISSNSAVLQEYCQTNSLPFTSR